MNEDRTLRDLPGQTVSLPRLAPIERPGVVVACFGEAKGLSFRIRSRDSLRPFLDEKRVLGETFYGSIVEWTELLVMATLESGHKHVYLLARDPGARTRLTFGPFFVRGPLRVAETIDDPRMAERAWRCFSIR